MSSAHPTLLIVGPTAGGKSALAMALCERFDGEIVSADSMQVYRRLDIGTAKPTPEERQAVPHHLIDIREPSESFSVSEWLELADRLVGEIRARARVPIVVGGTHLYAKAFLEGIFDGPSKDEGLRAELAALDPGERRAELERVDPSAAARIHPNDERRTIRALEVYRLTGKPISEHQQQWDPAVPRPADGPGIQLVGLTWSNEAVNRRINARVRAMVEQGLVEEVRTLWEEGILSEQSREATGYKQLVEHFEGRCSLDDAVERIKIDTRRLAKNQRTWLRRLRATPGSIWIEGEGDPGGPAGWADKLLKKISSGLSEMG